LWAIENVNGLGWLLAQQLVARGEQVVDVPATLSARARKLSGHSARKTDPFDARAVVIAARHHRSLRQVMAEDLSATLGLLVDRRWHVVSMRHRTRCRLHALFGELIPGGAPPKLSLTRASALLRTIRPVTAVDAERRQVARELLDDWRWCDRRIKTVEQRLRDAVTAHGTTLTDLQGIGAVGAATIISIAGDLTRFPTIGHFAAFNGTAPIEASSGDVKRHRLNRRGNRQLNKTLHTMAVIQIRWGGPGREHYQRKLAEGKSPGEAIRSLKRQLSDVVYRRLARDVRNRTVRGGQQGTRLSSA
jgi:transposase